jgi:multicomponent Na+:H+ antiporter subunit C
MEIMLAVLVGVLVAAAAYLMMSGKLLPYLFGLVLLSNAANLVLFASGRLTYAEPPLVPYGAYALEGPVANALPQALILTAIVIGFGLLSFALALVFRAYFELKTTRMDEMRVAEPEPKEHKIKAHSVASPEGSI